MALGPCQASRNRCIPARPSSCLAAPGCARALEGTPSPRSLQPVRAGGSHAPRTRLATASWASLRISIPPHSRLRLAAAASVGAPSRNGPGATSPSSLDASSIHLGRAVRLILQDFAGRPSADPAPPAPVPRERAPGRRGARPAGRARSAPAPPPRPAALPRAGRCLGAAPCRSAAGAPGPGGAPASDPACPVRGCCGAPRIPACGDRDAGGSA